MGRIISKISLSLIVFCIIFCSIFCPSNYKAAVNDVFTTSGSNVSFSVTQDYTTAKNIVSITDPVTISDNGDDVEYIQYKNIIGLYDTGKTVSEGSFLININSSISWSIPSSTRYYVPNVSLCLYTDRSASNGECVVLWSGTHEYTLDNIFDVGDNIKVGLLLTCDSYSKLSDSSGLTESTISGKVTYSISFVEYDMYNSYYQLFSILEEMLYQNDDLLAKLQEIDDNTDTVESKLSSLLTYVQNNYNKLTSIDSRIANIYTQLTSIYSKLDSINSGIGDINSELDTQTNILGSISSGVSNFYDAFLEYTGLGSSSTVPDAPDTSGVSNQIQMEQQLLGKDTSAAVNNLNITIDMSANGFIWSFIDGALQSNAIVFGGFISLLTIGFIKLFLGR